MGTSAITNLNLMPMHLYIRCINTAWNKSILCHIYLAPGTDFHLLTNSLGALHVLHYFKEENPINLDYCMHDRIPA